MTEIEKQERDKEKTYFAKRIRDIRHEFGYTQEKFSEITCIPYNQLIRYENARQRPPYSVLLTIFDKLDISADYFFERADKHSHHSIPNNLDLNALKKEITRLNDILNEP